MQKVLDGRGGLRDDDIMPRSARLDAPGVLHHLIGRGIERRKIFYKDKDKDREDFVCRLTELVEKGAWSIYACAYSGDSILISCHFQSEAVRS